MTLALDTLQELLMGQPYPYLFVTVSGAHLYGFASPDSDVDLRGVHLLPPEQVVGLDTGPDTLDVSELRGDIDLDLVSHEAHKFFRLLLKPNGYVLEQLFSPLIVHTSPEHEELKAIAHNCITRFHSHHYLGFAQSQWALYTKGDPPKIKPLLYTYRVLLTGIHLMRTGQVEANLAHLNAIFNLPQLPDLIRAKVEGGERDTLEHADQAFHVTEVDRLRAALETARDASHLPPVNTCRPALHDLLVRLRLNGR